MVAIRINQGKIAPYRMYFVSEFIDLCQIFHTNLGHRRRCPPHVQGITCVSHAPLPEQMSGDTSQLSVCRLVR